MIIKIKKAIKIQWINQTKKNKVINLKVVLTILQMNSMKI